MGKRPGLRSGQYIIGWLIPGVGVVPWIARSREPTCAASKFLLTAALAAIGLAADIRAQPARGLRPVSPSWLFISGFSPALNEMVY